MKTPPEFARKWAKLGWQHAALEGRQERWRNPCQRKTEQPDGIQQSRLRRLGKTGLLLSPVGFGAKHTRSRLIATLWTRYESHRNRMELRLWTPRQQSECIGRAIAEGGFGFSRRGLTERTAGWTTTSARHGVQRISWASR